MIKTIAEIFKLLNKKQRKDFLLLQPLIALMSGLEILSILMIGAFIGLVTNPESIPTNDLYLYALSISPNLSNNNFIILSAISVIIFITCSALISMFIVWRLALFASFTGAELSKSLFDNYISKNWVFHASVNSSELIKNIVFQTQRFTGGVLNPLMQLTAKSAIVVGMILGMFAHNWVAALAISGILLGTYFLLFSTVKKLLLSNGLLVTSSMSIRYRTASEAFSGIRDVIMMNKRSYYSKKFQKSSLDFAKATGHNVALIAVPKYFIEWLGFSSAVLTLIYFNSRTDLNYQYILPQVTFFILAGSKLIPALQQIYAIGSSIKADISSFEVFRYQFDRENYKNKRTVDEKINFEKSISLSDIYFSYPDANRPALKNISIKINKNETIGFVGPSGGGKSTLVDLLVGLISADTGTIKIDDSALDDKNIAAWRAKIGYYSQDTFISDGNIAQNIAFGCEDNEINFDRVNHILNLVALSSMVSRSKNGVYEPVGEKGVNLSGGQLQRLGIGRTMYDDPDILVFDEATAALDSLTEEKILATVKKLKGSKTLIMIAHRLNTLVDCDRIFVIDDGDLVTSGTYSELSKTNQYFKHIDRKGKE